jgi:hypothetical protein
VLPQCERHLLLQGGLLQQPGNSTSGDAHTNGCTTTNIINSNTRRMSCTGWQTQRHDQGGAHAYARISKR